MAESKDIYLASKPRYEILDGLRGVAAMMVVAFHFFESYSKGPTYQILNHGYLAVDFFFVLSGFVIGYAYDDRWQKMSTWNFFKRRLVRLHPLLVLGTVIGACVFFLTDGPQFPLVGNTTMGMFLLTLLMGCLMIPTPVSMDIRGWQETNSFNGASWSLMWEYVANILYALFIRKFSRGVLALFVFLSALLTIDVTLNLDVTGLLEVRSSAAYTIIGGWSLTADQLYIGLTRLLYPFFAGLLLSRMGKFITLKGGFWWTSLLIVIVMGWPYIGGTELNIKDGIYQLVVITIVFPLIVAIGAGSRVSGKHSEAVCKFFGDISYPLYITHFPFMYIYMTWAANHAASPLWHKVALAVGMFFVMIGVAYASLKLYDEPVREWLRKKLFKVQK